MKLKELWKWKDYVIYWALWIAAGLIINYFWADDINNGVFVFISGLMWGAAISVGVLHRFFRIERKLPYKWACSQKGCTFAVQANHSPALILQMAEKHEHDHDIGLIE